MENKSCPITRYVVLGGGRQAWLLVLALDMMAGRLCEIRIGRKWSMAIAGATICQTVSNINDNDLILVTIAMLWCREPINYLSVIKVGRTCHHPSSSWCDGVTTTNMRCGRFPARTSSPAKNKMDLSFLAGRARLLSHHIHANGDDIKPQPRQKKQEIQDNKIMNHGIRNGVAFATININGCAT